MHKDVSLGLKRVVKFHALCGRSGWTQRWDFWWGIMIGVVGE